METLFSHIIQKRFSQSSEDVATDALAYILESSDSACGGMMKLLRGIEPTLPELRFETQLTEGSIRPDMWGLDGFRPRVYVENKFWAGLTDNQPVPYLRELAAYDGATILLVVGPEAREHALWRELVRRLEDEGISTSGRDAGAGVLNVLSTDLGPVMAITSWPRLLSALELEVADEPHARGDLLQLRALCEAADREAFAPVAREEVTDQRTPAFLLQLGSILQASVELAVNEGVLGLDGLRPSSSWEGFGRYVRFSQEIDPWLGVRFGAWKTFGLTPLWLLFYPSILVRHADMQRLLEQWASESGAFVTMHEGSLLVAVSIPLGEDKDRVAMGIVTQLRAIGAVLAVPADDREDSRGRQ